MKPLKEGDYTCKVIGVKAVPTKTAGAWQVELAPIFALRRYSLFHYTREDPCPWEKGQTVKVKLTYVEASGGLLYLRTELRAIMPNNVNFSHETAKAICAAAKKYRKDGHENMTALDLAEVVMESGLLTAGGYDAASEEVDELTKTKGYTNVHRAITRLITD